MTAMGSEVAPEHHIRREAKCHTHRGRTESVVESDASLQQPGDQRTNEGAEVDTKVNVLSNDEAWASTRPLRARPAPGHSHARQPRHDGARNVSAHHHHAAVQHRALHAEQPVGDPTA
jgi:hypothetical protein